MNPLFLSRIKLSDPRFLSVFSLASLLLALLFVCQVGRAQQPEQLSLADILIGLRSKKVTLAERNKLLSDAVKVRGITVTSTPEIEAELQNTGADSQLLEAIKQISSKMNAIFSPKIAPVAATPEPTPKPFVPDFAFIKSGRTKHRQKAITI